MHPQATYTALYLGFLKKKIIGLFQRIFLVTKKKLVKKEVSLSHNLLAYFSAFWPLLKFYLVQREPLVTRLIAWSFEIPVNTHMHTCWVGKCHVYTCRDVYWAYTAFPIVH